jgi:hypothetical protein
VINNRRKDNISVAAVEIAGQGFELSQVPLLPANIVGGGEIRFNVLFVPPPRGGKYTGQLRVSFPTEQRTFELAATGTAPELQLLSLTEDGAIESIAGPVVSFGNAPINISRSVRYFGLRNVGNAEARIGNIAVTGTAFTLVDPPQPPYTVAPNESLYFGVAFVPRTIGEQRGQLRLDTTTYTLAGRGTGPQLASALAFGDVRIPLREMVNAVVPNTDVGSRRVFGIEISNSGDETGYVAAVTVDGPSFSLTRETIFPLAVPPGQTVRVDAVFAPLEVGTILGSLLVHDQTYKLIGVGREPPPLPEARFVGVPAQSEALSQPAVGLELIEPYPHELTGRLILSFSSESFLDDPAVQFVSGNRTVDFRIPAGTTQALFGAGLRTIRMQTGSLAGTITLVASISAGKFDLTTSTPPVATVDIPSAPPVVRSLSIIAKSSRIFDLVIRGASPARAVDRFDFVLTPSPGVRLGTTNIRVNVGSQFETWYRSADSRPFGSQFTATVTFELSADFSAIQSIEARAINGLGASLPKSVVVATTE